MSDHLDRARENRAGLRAAIGRVERSLAAPAGDRAERWAKELGTQLDDLADALELHIATTEAPNGLLDEIVQLEPRLAHQAWLMREDHVALRDRLDAARAALPHETAGVAAARDATVELLGAVVRHRHAGADLVYEAYNVDMEAAD